MCATEPDEKIVASYLEAGGDPAGTWGQVVLAWAGDEEQGLADAHAQFRFAAGGWKVQSELPNPINFEAATANVTEDDVAELVSCGPDPEVHATAIRRWVDAGFTHVAVAQVGPDQGAFLRMWQAELHDRVRA